jgi:hypothetical protein
MSRVPRNAPCPCGSGKKYKKCCLPRDEVSPPEPPERITHGTRRSFATSRERTPERLPEAHAWPVDRVYVPIPDVWCATGMGTVAVVRRRPDGRIAYGAFLLNLSEHGITGAFGKTDPRPAAEESFLDDMRDMIPPMQEGSLEDASAFVYGAMALADSQDAGFPPDEIGPYLDLLPPPPGAAQQWLDGLIGRGGRTPAGLVRIVADLPSDVDIPDGQEIAVATEMEFRLPEASASLARAPAKFPPISDGDGTARFHHTPVPTGTPSKHGTPGKVQGEVRICGDHVVAIALTLSMAARLIADLREWLGPGISLTAVRWGNSVTRRCETALIDRG